MGLWELTWQPSVQRLPCSVSVRRWMSSTLRTTTSMQRFSTQWRSPTTISRQPWVSGNFVFLQHIFAGKQHPASLPARLLDFTLPLIACVRTRQSVFTLFLPALWPMSDQRPKGAQRRSVLLDLLEHVFMMIEASVILLFNAQAMVTCHLQSLSFALMVANISPAFLVSTR